MSQVQDKIWGKKDYERYIAERFCEHLDDAHVIDNGEKPDCLISVKNQHVGLELASIRRLFIDEKTSDKDRMHVAYDHIADGFSDFSRFVEQQARADSRARGLIDARPRYIAPTPKSKDPAGKYQISRLNVREACCGEILKLVDCHIPEGNYEERSLYFKEDHPEGNLDFAPDEIPVIRWINKSDYPNLRRYFECFYLIGGGEFVFKIGPGFVPEVACDAEIYKVIVDHIDRLVTYRKNLLGKPIWLLLYLEGTCSSRRCLKRDVKRIEDIYRKVARESKKQFDQVWLGKGVLFGESAVRGQPSSTGFYRLS